MSARARALLSALAVGAFALTPAAAGAAADAPVAHHVPLGSTVVPFKSIGVIKLGMIPQAVLRKLGKPSSVQRLNGEISELGYNGGSVLAFFFRQNGRDQCDEVEAFGEHLHPPGHPHRELACVAQACLPRAQEAQRRKLQPHSGPRGGRRLTADRLHRVARQGRGVRPPDPLLPALAAQTTDQEPCSERLLEAGGRQSSSPD
jgi:hypothetical protein